MKSKAKLFIEGPISSLFIADIIEKHSTKWNIGAHHIFLGQVRNDTVEGKTTRAIEYTTYKELAEKEIYNIREEMFRKYNLICMHIFHSLGKVNVGEMCLFVFTSSMHRKDAGDACNEIVEEVKKRVPIWGKQIYEDATHTWKVNTK